MTVTLHADGQVLELEFASIGRDRLDELRDLHPDESTFWPALLAEACDEMDAAEAEQLWNGGKLSRGERDQVAHAAISATVGNGVDGILARLDRDPQLVLELEVCREYRIAHSVFLRWDERDQDHALAFVVYQRRRELERCAQCGHVSEEWVNPVTRIPLKNPPYLIERHSCWACNEIENERQWFDANADEAEKRRMRVRFVPNPEYVPPAG